MNQIHIVVDGFVPTKEYLEKIEESSEEFAGFKRHQSSAEKADPCAIQPPLPATAKTLSVAKPGSSSGSPSKLRVVSLIPPAAQKPSSVIALIAEMSVADSLFADHAIAAKAESLIGHRDDAEPSVDGCFWPQSFCFGGGTSEAVG
jgi:hypothetical protein